MAPKAVDAPEGVRRPPTSIERERVLCDEPLPKRMQFPQQLEFADEFAGQTSGQVGVEAILERADPEFVQASAFDLGEVVELEFVERRSLPQLEGRIKRLGGCAWVDA